MSTDGGTVWEQRDSYYDDGGCCIVHPDSAHIILTGGKGPITQTNWSFVVSRSRNAGATWTRNVVSGSASGFCYALAVASSQRSLVYAGGEVSGSGAVYRSTDFGVTWSRTAASPGGTVQSLVVHPQEPNRVLAATAAGLFLTTNGGANWSSLPGTAGSRSVVFYPGGADTVLAGGDFGVMVSRNRGATWTRMNSGLEEQVVNCLGFSSRGGPFLVAGTGSSACFGWRFLTGVNEPTVNGESGTADYRPTIVRGVLCLGIGDTIPNSRTSSGYVPATAALLDAAGRKVMELRAGPNDVSRLAPGVYFLRSAGTAPIRTKVVLTR